MRKLFFLLYCFLILTKIQAANGSLEGGIIEKFRKDQIPCPGHYETTLSSFPATHWAVITIHHKQSNLEAFFDKKENIAFCENALQKGFALILTNAGKMMPIKELPNNEKDWEKTVNSNADVFDLKLVLDYYQKNNLIKSNELLFAVADESNYDFVNVLPYLNLGYLESGFPEKESLKAFIEYAPPSSESAYSLKNDFSCKIENGGKSLLVTSAALFDEKITLCIYNERGVKVFSQELKIKSKGQVVLENLTLDLSAHSYSFEIKNSYDIITSNLR